MRVDRHLAGVLPVALLALPACLGPLPHPVVLSNVGHVEVGAGVETFTSAFQGTAFAQVGIVPHLQLEAAGEYGAYAQWQVQPGLRGEVLLGQSPADSLQFALAYEHRAFWGNWGCGGLPLRPSPSNPCAIAASDTGTFEVGYVHSSRGWEARSQSPSVGLFLGAVAGAAHGSDQSGIPTSGDLLLLSARVSGELPLARKDDDGFAFLVGVAGDAPLASGGRFFETHNAALLYSLVLSLGLARSF